MKKLTYLIICVSFLFSNACLGDIIPNNSHYVTKYVKITNTDDFPEISLLGIVLPYNDYFKTEIVRITSSEYLPRNYRNCDFNIYALRIDYLNGQDLKKLDFINNQNSLGSNIKIRPFNGYLSDSAYTSISEIQEYYKIVGFSKTQVILHKWKEVNKFDNGKPDSTITYTFEGDVSLIYQTIQVGTKSKQNISSFEVFPNPARKNFHMKMNNSYHGTVSIQLINLDGKIVKSQNVSKTTQILDKDICIENLKVGSYYIFVKFGELVENKKIVIH